jgi:hypothetical protein
MINVNDEPCFCGLSSRPNFNYEGLVAKYCSKCKLENMINVTHKLCVCGKSQASINYPGLSPAYCKFCREEGMILVHKRTCIECKKNQATYNLYGLKPRYCNKCRSEEMINVADKCKNENCLSTGSIKYNYYCTFCFQHLFPDTELAKNINNKTKENYVRDYLKDNFDGFVHDIALWTGNCDCSHRRRIDFRILIGNTLLCIEVDENQHKYYDKTEEEIRYDDLYMLHGGKFVFIRFNPDKFKSMLGTNKNPTMKKRMEYLHQEINFQIDRINCEKNEELLEIAYLFYDGFHYTEC